VSKILAHWNELPQDEAVREIVACCGSGTWSAKMASRRPIQDEATLLALSMRFGAPSVKRTGRKRFGAIRESASRALTKLSRRSRQRGPNKNNKRLRRRTKP